jgi:hypothetical protein
MALLDEEGPHALVQIPQPVNRFPNFMGYLLRRLDSRLFRGQHRPRTRAPLSLAAHTAVGPRETWTSLVALHQIVPRAGLWF